MNELFKVTLEDKEKFIRLINYAKEFCKKQDECSYCKLSGLCPFHGATTFNNIDAEDIVDFLGIAMRKSRGVD